MIEKSKLKPEQAKALKDLEKLIGENIPLVEKVEFDTFGVKIEGDKVVGLGLSHQRLSTLPESIGNLKSLIYLTLEYNQLSTLPESIGNLKSLKELWLWRNELTIFPESVLNLKSLQLIDLRFNKLSILPESIDNLKSLQTLYLRENQLLTLPESIGNLKSLETLDLDDNKLLTLPESIGNLSSLKELNLYNNKLSTLPESLWKCQDLEGIDLDDNSWGGEWKGIETHSLAKVLELCRERAPITLFVSYFKKDNKKYCVRNLKENLKNREEIREVYSSGVPKIPESHLILFIATKNSITDNECLHELGLALNGDIGIIPIKGSDITFENLSQVDLRSEGHGFFNLKDKKGFEFDGDEKKLEKFCDELYEYIKQYKRDFNLFDVEARKFDVERKNVKNIIKRLIESEKLRAILKESLEQLEGLSEKLKSEQISPVEYIFRLDKILNSK